MEQNAELENEVLRIERSADRESVSTYPVSSVQSVTGNSQVMRFQSVYRTFSTVDQAQVLL